MNYTNPWLTGSKPSSIGALDGLGHMQQQSYFQCVTAYPENSLESSPAAGQKVDNCFHRVGRRWDQIAHEVNGTAAGRLRSELGTGECNKGNRWVESELFSM